MNRTCPDCGSYNPEDSNRCGCGRQLRKTAAQSKQFPLYLAVLPLILPLFFMVNAARQYMHVSAASEIGQKKMPIKAQSCVDTYGVTLSNSHEYVETKGPLKIPVKRDPNKPRHMATVLHGMVRNTCAETFRRVVLHMVVKGDQETRGTGDYEVLDLIPGVTQSFERAWMGNVTSWEITADK